MSQHVAGQPFADAVALLTDWLDRELPKDQRSLGYAYLSFLAARPDALLRSCEPGHLTASALVLSADRSEVLLTLHPRVGLWLQLGGHLEPGDRSVRDAALREATEESGIDGLLLDPVPRHLDVQFRAYAPVGAVHQISAESDDLAWHPVDRLPELADESVRDLVAAALC